MIYGRFGPGCTIRVLATVPVNPGHSNAQLLNDALTLAQKWDDKSRESVRILNRSVIMAEHRTLQIDVEEWESADLDEDVGTVMEFEDGLEGWDIDAPSYRTVHISLTGYAGPLTWVDSMLRKEVVYLLESIATAMAHRQDGLMFTLEARLDGPNPFLTFYLRDVPMRKVKDFTLDLEKT